MYQDFHGTEMSLGFFSIIYLKFTKISEIWEVYQNFPGNPQFPFKPIETLIKISLELLTNMLSEFFSAKFPWNKT